MKPFFTYFGGKYRAAPHYPSPRFDTVIEPFAGSAGYSVRYPHLRVVLADKDPLIANLWRYLINVKVSEVASLPLDFEHVDSLSVAQEAKWLIGFWLNKGTVQPCKSPGRWMCDKIRPNSFWGEVIRARIAGQVDSIRHWQVIECSYDSIPDVTATWFVDPPYESSGHAYKESSKSIDFNHLGAWCKAQDGQVIVCEEEGAAWLPFQPFRTIKGLEGRSGGKVSHEVVWIK